MIAATVSVSGASAGGQPRYQMPLSAKRIAASILLIAAVWRIAIAWAIPCIARDSVNFCEYARDLGEQGLRYLKNPDTRQHPLYPLLVLAAQRLARGLGAPDSPMTWQRCGQAVSLVAGLAVVALAGVLTRRLVVRLNLPLDASFAGCCAMLLAALLPLNVSLSAEAMSDQPHLAFYLAGAIALLSVSTWQASLGCGLAAAAAFLTRPEGAVVALAGCAAALVEPTLAARARLARATTVLIVFVSCAAPYWAITGRISPKKDPLEFLRSASELYESAPPFSPSLAHAARCVTFARLERLELPWYGLLPWLFYVLLRAGRVVVPLLALPGVLELRRRLLQPPLLGLSACLAGHSALALLLLAREGYLAPRHLLAVVMLLLPFSAVLLARLLELARTGRWRASWVVAFFAAVLTPLVVYSVRLPNAADRYLPDVANYLLQCDASVPVKTIMSGSSLRRVAFYAGARWIPWHEIPEQKDQLVRAVLRRRPDYFLIETGPGFEREGNDSVVGALDSSRALAASVRRRQTIEVPRDGRLHIYEFDWSQQR